MMTHQSLIPWLAPSMNSHAFVAPQRPFWWRALSATIVSATLVFAHGHAQAQTPTRTSTIEQAVPLSQVPTALVKVPDGRLLAPDIARIVTNGELVVAMLKVDTPPFFFFNEKGDWVGLEVDLAEAIAKELGVKLRINRDAGSFNAVVDILAKGEADLAISKLSRTLARTQTIAFSNTYLTLNHALLINRVKFAQIAKGRALPEVVRSFDGSIGVIAKSSFADYARRNFPKAKIEEYPTWNSVLVALQKGEVAGAYRDEFEIKRVLNSDPTASLVLRTVTLKDLEDTLGIGVAVSSPRLLAFVNEFLAQRAEKLDITKVLQALERK